MRIEEKMAALKLQLPEPPAQRGKLRPAIRVGNVVRTSGQTPALTGKVGKDVTVEQAYDAARETILRCLMAVKWVIGDLDKVKQVVHVFGMVNAADGFTNTPAVIHGATDLLLEVFGDTVGWHTRSAVGFYQLPGNAAVEIELTVEVSD
jgi:enamine deaminase RidA (YjgF/YER057c/UK114 family)